MKKEVSDLELRLTRYSGVHYEIIVSRKDAKFAKT